MKHWVYNIFRESSANIFSKFCNAAGHSAKSDTRANTVFKRLYYAVRFMGNPHYYSTSTLREPESDNMRAQCTLLSVAHNADLTRCFGRGRNQAFYENLRAAFQTGLTTEQQTLAEKNILNFYRYISQYQIATHDRCLEAMHADGKFRPHETQGSFGPDFVELNNSPEKTLQVLRKIPTLISTALSISR